MSSHSLSFPLGGEASKGFLVCTLAYLTEINAQFLISKLKDMNTVIFQNLYLKQSLKR